MEGEEEGNVEEEHIHIPVYMLVRSSASDGRDFPCSALLKTAVAVEHTTVLSCVCTEKFRRRCSSPRMMHW